MSHGVDYNLVPMLNFLIFIALLSLEKYTLKYLEEKSYVSNLLLNGSGKTVCVCVCLCVCVCVSVCVTYDKAKWAKYKQLSLDKGYSFVATLWYLKL